MESLQQDLLNLQAQDKGFSQILFLDYVQNVFHQYYHYQNNESLKTLQAFFLEKLSPNPKFAYSEIVINAMRIEELAEANINNKIFDSIAVFIEANFSQINSKTGEKHRFISEEIWTFVRQKSDAHGQQTQSLAPDKMQALACPACAATASFQDSLHCKSCGNNIEPASLQWAVAEKNIDFQESYVSNQLISYEEEEGTDFPTIFSEDLAAAKKNFAALHQLKDINTYSENFADKVVKPAFKAIYTAWTNKNLQPVRHIMSDFIYQSQEFWIAEYKTQKLSNKLDDINVDKVELVKIDIDKYCESLTVRIFADCKDYTIQDATGEVVGGNKKEARFFSEYWTFVRLLGAGKQPKDNLDFENCPSCAAALDKIEQAGTCGYCGEKISSGAFSWVLTLITQDEAYA